ncbi:hypothetical protein B7463_g7621, partial [Scytalidium lignicola]
MEKISQSLQDVLGHVQAVGTSLHIADPDTPETGPSKVSNSAQSWPASAPASQQLSEGASVTSTLQIEQLPPFLNIPDLPTAINDRLPSEEILQELVELFFELIYPWVPLFHKPSFRANLFSPGRQILLHGIVVVAFRFWRQPAPSAEVRDNYVKISREQILLSTIDTCSLISTQALALLAVDAIGQGPGPRTWNIMAMLITASKQIGLAKGFSPAGTETNTALVRNEDPDENLDLSSIEVEEKRRLFWTIYSLDRFFSVSHGQSCSIDTKSINLQYPARDEDWGQPVAPEWFQGTAAIRSTHVRCLANLWHYNIDLLALLDRSNQLLIQPLNFSLPAHCQEWQSSFRRLDIAMSTWFENLPREVRERPANFDPMWTMIHATFHLIRIRMYTVAASPSTKSLYLRPSSSAPARCRQAVRDVAYLTICLQPHELDQLGPTFAFVVWVAARSLVILWTKGYESTYGSIPADLEPLLSALRQLSLRWPCAQRYNDIIQLILDTKNNPGGPTGLEIFNDTRRTVYGLQNHLGLLAGHRIPEMYSHSLDFLDMDLDDLTSPWTGTFGSEMDSEWL